jgi:predicted metal-dependent enzyme (double-stranded beta helix superfamily)
MREATRQTLQHLVERLDTSVRLGDVHTVTSRVKTARCDLIRAHELEMPDRYCRPLPDGSARRLLHRDEGLGYTAVVMTWGPGQKTGLRDHAGMRRVAGVIAGEMNRCRVHEPETDGLWRRRDEPLGYDE